MRYVSTDDTGQITLHATLPQFAVRVSDGARFRIHTLRREDDKTILLGGNDSEEARFEMVGFVDVSDLAADAIPGWMLEFPTFEEIHAKWYRGGSVKAHRVIKREEIPEDRTFRAAWRATAKQINVNMNAAREIQRNHIRKLRDGMFPALDAAYLRADELGDAEQKRAIAAEKQRLRDLPADPRIEAATTPDELKAIVP